MTHPTNPTDPTEQRRIRDMLVRDAIFTTDIFMMDHAADLQRVTAANRTRLTLQAAIGFLLAQGLITATPDDQRPEWMALDLPEHLRPDLAEAIAQLDRMNRALPR